MLASLLVGLVKAKSLELKFPWKYVYRVRSTCTYFVVSVPRREGGNFFIFQIWRIYLKMGKKINKKLHILNKKFLCGVLINMETILN